MPSEALLQALLARPPAYAGGSGTGAGFAQAGAAIGDAISRYRAGSALEDQRAAMLDMLAGKPGGAQMGPTLPGAGPGALQGINRAPDAPSMVPEMTRQQIQAVLLAPGGQEALTKAMLARAMPEPITPYQQANLDLDQQRMGLQERGVDLQAQQLTQQGEQFDTKIGLERQKLAADNAYNAAKLKLDELEAKAKGAPKLSDVGGIRKEYTGASEDFVKIRDAHSKIEKIGTGEPSPAGDLALIINYMKMLDPTSAVKESEAATVAASGSFGDRLQAWGQQLLTGERLTPTQRVDLLGQSNNVMQSQLDQQLRLESEFQGLAERYKVPGQDVTPDLIGRLREGLPEFAKPPKKDLIERGKEMMGEAVEELVPKPESLGAPKRISGDDEYDALSSGSRFVGPDGQVRIKP